MNLRTYQQKPIKIQAVQLTRNNMYEILDWIRRTEPTMKLQVLNDKISIYKMNSDHEVVFDATENDYICRNNYGMFKAFTEDDFDRIYEVV